MFAAELKVLLPLFLFNTTLTPTLFLFRLTDTLYVQNNNLTGPWPIEYCTESMAFREFGLDCDEVTDCVCCSPLNCYYSSETAPGQNEDGHHESMQQQHHNQ